MATLTVSSGGTYTGGTYDHVAVNTTAHVELSGLTVAGTGHLITPSGAVDLDIHDCTFSSTGSSDHLLDCPNWQKIRFVHNTVTTNAGIKLNQYNGGGGSSSCVFTNNDFHNINVPSGSGYRQMFQIDNSGGSSVSGMEIGWNRVTNDSPSVTEIEDCVSIFNTNGASSGDPIRVHDNLFDGCWDPRGAGYSGGGVMLGDNGGSHQLSDGNVVLRTANYGIAIAGGNDCKHQNCTVLSATAAIGSGAAQAAYVWGQGGAATNATITGCDLGLYRGSDGMQNVYNPNGEGTFTNNNLRSSCSTADENAARTAYLNRATATGQTFGAGTGGGGGGGGGNASSVGMNWPNAGRTYLIGWDQNTITYANRATVWAAAAAAYQQVVRVFTWDDATIAAYVTAKGATGTWAPYSTPTTARTNVVLANMVSMCQAAAAQGVSLVLSPRIDQPTVTVLNNGGTYANLNAAQIAITTSGSTPWLNYETVLKDAVLALQGIAGVYGYETCNEPNYMLGADAGTITHDALVNFCDHFNALLKTAGATRVGPGSWPLYDPTLMTDAQVITFAQHTDWIDCHFYPPSTTDTGVSTPAQAQGMLSAHDTYVSRVRTLLGRPTMPVIIGEYGTLPWPSWSQAISAGAISRGWQALAWGFDAYDVHSFTTTVRPEVLAYITTANSVSGGGGSGTTTLANNASGGTNGTTVSPANSGGTSGDAFSAVTGTVAFDNTHYHSAAMAYKYTTAPTATDVTWSFASQTTLYARFYLYASASPTATFGLLSFLSGAGNHAVLLLDAITNKLHLWVAGVAEPVTTNAIPMNAWCRIEAKCFADAGSGYLEVKLFNSPDSTTPTETISTTTGNTGTLFDGIVFGDTTYLTAPPTGYVYWLDDLAIGSAGYVGPINTGTTPITLPTETAACADAFSYVFTAKALTVAETIHGVDALSHTVSGAPVVTDTASGVDAISHTTTGGTVGVSDVVSGADALSRTVTGGPTPITLADVSFPTDDWLTHTGGSLPLPVLAPDFEKLEWVDHDGNIIPLTQRLSGKGRWMPPVRIVRDQYAGLLGTRARQVTLDTASVVVPVLVTTSTADDYRNLVRAMASSLNPLRGPGKLRATLTHVDASVTVREMVAYYAAGMDFPEDQLDVGVPSLLFNSEGPPYWTDAADTTVTYTNSATAYTWFPLGGSPWIPLQLNQSTIYAQTTVVNDGDAPVYPVWTLTGPASGVIQFDNLTTDKSLWFNYSITAGQPAVVIDTRPGVKSITQGPVSLYRYLTAWDMWPLELERNDIALTVPGATAVTHVELTYRRGFLAA